VLDSYTSKSTRFFQEKYTFFTPISCNAASPGSVIAGRTKEMQKFLKVRTLFTRIRIMSESGNARQSKTELEFVEIFASKTPAVEPLAQIRQIPSRTESYESSQRHQGEGSVETWRHQGEPEGARGCCAPRAQQLLFKRPLQPFVRTALPRGTGN
jgi:hypothetical protein